MKLDTPSGGFVNVIKGGEREELTMGMFINAWNSNLKGHVKMEESQFIDDLRVLEFLGKSGWELVTVINTQATLVHDDVAQRYILKRPVKAP
jgi:hypothetical protein